MRWWLATGLFLGLIMPISYAQPCEFHPVPAFDKGLVRVEPYGTSGLVGFYYDLDGDLIPDRALLFQRDAAGAVIPWPQFYMEGLNEDGQAEETWEDTGGEGLCRDIRLYWKRRL